MGEAVFNSFIHNGNVYDAQEFDNIYKDNPPSVYEVIRIIDGIPLFLEEHYERLKNSAELIGYKIDMKFEDIKGNIDKMVKLNNVLSNNIKIIVNNFSINSDYYFYFIKSRYPDESLYKKGIRTFLYSSTRENPNAKIINSNLRRDVDALLHRKDCYEALLVNSYGEITEGSRSNLFFIRDGRVYTSPPGDVLMGITRQRIIKLCTEHNIEVVETAVHTRDLSKFEAAFISGTSPKVLPVSVIDDMSFSTSNGTLLKIMEIYNREIDEYIKHHK